MINLDVVKKAKGQILEGSLTIWNARLEALIETGDVRAAIDHLRSPVEWGDNCTCGNNCRCGGGAAPFEDVVQPAQQFRKR